MRVISGTHPDARDAVTVATDVCERACTSLVTFPPERHLLFFCLPRLFCWFLSSCRCVASHMVFHLIAGAHGGKKNNFYLSAKLNIDKPGEQNKYTLDNFYKDLLLHYSPTGSQNIYLSFLCFIVHTFCLIITWIIDTMYTLLVNINTNLYLFDRHTVLNNLRPPVRFLFIVVLKLVLVSNIQALVLY